MRTSSSRGAGSVTADVAGDASAVSSRPRPSRREFVTSRAREPSARSITRFALLLGRQRRRRTRGTCRGSPRRVSGSAGLPCARFDGLLELLAVLELEHDPALERSIRSGTVVTRFISVAGPPAAAPLRRCTGGCPARPSRAMAARSYSRLYFASRPVCGAWIRHHVGEEVGDLDLDRLDLLRLRPGGGARSAAARPCSSARRRSTRAAGSSTLGWPGPTSRARRGSSRGRRSRARAAGPRRARRRGCPRSAVKPDRRQLGGDDTVHGRAARR